jgi:CheY-like chemotaxis protein
MPATETAKFTGVIRPLVLVVDDDPAVLEALQGLLVPRLEPLFRVECAGSGEEALEIVGARSAEEAPVAAVISDEKMPGCSGTDLLIALRQSPAHRHGGRMIITAYAGLESAKRAINEAEVERYFPKPWDAEGALLPALGGILEHFCRERELDVFHVTAVANWATERTNTLAVRRAWWEYLELMGLPAEEAGVEVPSFEDGHDAGATHFVVTRISPGGRAVAAAIRLCPGAAGAPATLGTLAFLPEEANEANETLLVRAAVLHVAEAGLGRVRTEAPALRRGVYEALGFAPVGTPPEGAPTLAMEARSFDLAAGPGRAFERRLAAGARLCRCQQHACPAHDYAAARRGYFCPLDLAEGRAPRGFPTPTLRA